LRLGNLSQRQNEIYNCIILYGFWREATLPRVITSNNVITIVICDAIRWHGDDGCKFSTVRYATFNAKHEIIDKYSQNIEGWVY